MRALKRVVAQALREHTFPVREPVHFSLLRPPPECTRQFRLFGAPIKTSILGTFYDTVTAALYGGEICGNRALQVPYFNEGEPFFADIFDPVRKTVRESKACNSTHTLVLKDKQRENYLGLQGNHPDWSVLHYVYRHGVAGIVAYEGTEHMLYADLSQQTAFSVVLPSSIIESLGEVRKDTDDVFLVSHCEGYARRHKDGNDVSPSMRVSSRLINLLFSSPEDALRKLALDPDRYGVDRYLTHGGLNIKRRDDENDPATERAYFVKPFPVVAFTDRNHEPWARDLGEKMVRLEGCSDVERGSSLPAPRLESPHPGETLVPI
ncbi:MAG: hypothetical protein AABX53_02520 [Nanoarchaeota archaeon]